MADTDKPDPELVVESVRVHVPSGNHLLLLKEVGGERVLPIWVGLWEARAIAVWLQGERPERPLTHDLLAAAVAALSARLDRVLITRLVDKTFFATLELVTAAGRVELDARPSDAVALAIRLEAPIYAAAEVLERAGTVLEDLAGSDDTDATDDEAPSRRPGPALRPSGPQSRQPSRPGAAEPPAVPPGEITGERIDPSKLTVFRDFVNSIDDTDRRGNSGS